MYAVTKFLAQKIPLAKFQYIVLKNRSNEIRSNEIRIRRELPVFESNPSTSKSTEMGFASFPSSDFAVDPVVNRLDKNY